MEWIESIKARGWGSLLSLMLDTFAPFGPLGAQMLYVAQPALGLFVGREMLNDIAHALEEPGGIEELRRLLDEESEPM